jgi:formylmethanofuran dehydrogenase subunit D
MYHYNKNSCLFAFENLKNNIMLAKQVLKDQQGIPMGVFIPMQTWKNIVLQYPDIESLDIDIPQWEKDFIDERIAKIEQYPERLQPIEMLFEIL